MSTVQKSIHVSTYKALKEMGLIHCQLRKIVKPDQQVLRGCLGQVDPVRNYCTDVVVFLNTLGNYGIFFQRAIERFEVGVDPEAFGTRGKWASGHGALMQMALATISTCRV